ncbi:PREDICTED: probable glycosyltransferase At5g03795 isoform X2 [Lupinus angustifolius]|uniref:probable glycosyltransferase At5g03795 isoform X2 n=1 Tax=Lupinus angustifolius TaxID=3871 RepID=UPI00092F81D0|nr:PREDICTED: probable glycosyltransferase At5g03795 isoform X2 [Lupinus angustifolius]
MGQKKLFLFRLKTNRLIWLIGITVAAIVVYRYFQFPYGNNTLPNGFYVDKIAKSGSSGFQAADLPFEPEIFNNVTIFNQANYTGAHGPETVTKTKTSEKKDTISTPGFVSESEIASNKSSGFHESDERSLVDSVRLSGDKSTIEKAKNLGPSSYNNTTGANLTKEVDISSGSEHKLAAPPDFTPSISPSTEVSTNFTPPVLSNGPNKTDSVNGERFKTSKGDVNILGKNSSTTILPKENKDSNIPVPEVTSISEMNKLLLQYHASNRSMPRWSSAADQELLQARSEIENAPVVENVENLYAPLYRNVSTFKRSYELMEQTLKVYVYREGSKPVMHSPHLLGIYASEGWFMRLMEVDKRFVTKDPKKAHLFYLPFSTRMLEHTLYVKNSPSYSNMIEYLHNYVDLIAGKHPYWNRTEGADHFLVACHDWAPSETQDHFANCIRALCNADVKEGFVFGKDVSLPETKVYSAQNPTKRVGGQPASRRTTLAFFAGGMHGYVRPILMKHWENKDPDMKIFRNLPRSRANRIYVDYMKSSKYCICAKGYEVNSPRVVEAIFYECVPVIISDNFVPPFFEILNWESFAVIIPEKDIPNLKSILLSIPEKRYLEMQMMVKKVQQHFLWHRNPVKYDIFHMILHSIWYNRVFTAIAR